MEDQGELELYQYLRALAFEPFNRPLERFILCQGKSFVAAKRPKGLHKRKNKQCYKNAALLSMETGMSYVEGYGIHNSLFPMNHAWCATDDGTVVDPTWRYPERSVYRGVVIPRDILTRQLLKNEMYGLLVVGEMIDIDLIEELKTLMKVERFQRDGAPPLTVATELVWGDDGA